MARRHRHFDSSFKLEVAKMVRDQGLSINEAVAVAVALRRQQFL
jgi:hypothetical protein